MVALGGCRGLEMKKEKVEEHPLYLQTLTCERRCMARRSLLGFTPSLSSSPHLREALHGAPQPRVLQPEHCLDLGTCRDA
jgi:hypothetical protein